MEPDSCICGKTYSSPAGLRRHQHSCEAQRKRTASLLSEAQSALRAKKLKAMPQADAMEATGPTVVSGHTTASPFTSLISASHHTLAAVPDSSEVTQSNDKSTDSPPHSPFQSRTHLSDSQESDLAQTLLQRKPWLARRAAKNAVAVPLPTPLPVLNPLMISQNSSHSPEAPLQQPLRWLPTTYNQFQLSRRYFATQYPLHDPEVETMPKDLEEIDDYSEALVDASIYWPYPNLSSFRLGEWYWNQGTKSGTDFRALIDVVGDPLFHSDEVRSVPWDTVNKQLSSQEWPDDGANWLNAAVTITVPFYPRRVANKDPEQPTLPRSYTVPGFRHRNFLAVIREKLTNTHDHPKFHYEPFELRWKPYASQPGDNDNDPGLRVYTELYTSDSFLSAHRELQTSPPVPGCSLPRVIAALMFWSDATHLTSFGDAKLHPLYLFFGNESKYRRTRPSAHLANHVAYFVNLPDSFSEFARQQTTNGMTADPALLAHCARELFHAQWRILLSPDFITAWKTGFEVLCADKIKRRVYPRIFTYSADYPEKVLLATIRNQGKHPCPRCLIPCTHTHLLGTESDQNERSQRRRWDDIKQEKVDKARQAIYSTTTNVQVNSQSLDKYLDDESLVPTVNSFHSALSFCKFDTYTMLTPDQLHEWELGGGKGVIVHLFRICDAVQRQQSGMSSLVAEVDKRYRLIPTFGSTIRQFSTNVSEMKKMAARDIEDIIQCSIPAFANIIPCSAHDTIVQELLFVSCQWHALAKLRLHTEYTVSLLKETSDQLGHCFRQFHKSVCQHYATRETAREFQNRKRREGKRASQGSVSSSTASTSTEKSRQAKQFNLNTYKFHALGDYAASIQLFGTTDNYSTEVGELEHKVSKQRYRRTSRKDFTAQIAGIERRETRIRRIKHRLERQKILTKSLRTVEDPPLKNLDLPFSVGQTQDQPLNIYVFARDYSNDPVAMNFIERLKAHFLPRILQLHPGHDEATASSNAVFLHNERIYQHQVMTIHYTSYDVRRLRDFIHPYSTTTSADIMGLLAPEHQSAHNRFWFARVVGIYHANVMYTGKGTSDYTPRRLDFLWVRFYKFIRATSQRSLDRLEFPPITDTDSFAFIDPAEVLRCCHVIPNFSQGRQHSNGKHTSAIARDGNDWNGYFINRFVDRDMFMRFCWGHGVGHTYSSNVISECEPEGIPVNRTPHASWVDHGDVYEVPRPVTAFHDATYSQSESTNVTLAEMPQWTEDDEALQDKSDRTWHLQNQDDLDLEDSSDSDGSQEDEDRESGNYGLAC